MAKKNQSTPEAQAAAAIKEASRSLVPYTKKYEKISTVNTEPEYKTVAEALSWAKSSVAEMEEKRKKIVKPFNDGVKAINADFKESKAPFEELITKLDKLLTDYEERRRQIEVKLAEKAARSAQKRGETQYAEDIRHEALTKSVAPEKAAVRSNVYWSSEVKNMRLLMQAVLDGVVDSDLVIPNQKKLDALARTIRKQDLKIPGVEGVSRIGHGRRRS